MKSENMGAYWPWLLEALYCLPSLLVIHLWTVGMCAPRPVVPSAFLYSWMGWLHLRKFRCERSILPNISLVGLVVASHTLHWSKRMSWGLDLRHEP